MGEHTCGLSGCEPARTAKAMSLRGAAKTLRGVTRREMARNGVFMGLYILFAAGIVVSLFLPAWR